MAAFTRALQRFAFQGISLLPPDALPPGKFPYVQNLRAYQETALQTRPGLSTLGNVAGGTVHTIWRLNDPSSYASLPALRILGSTNGTLYSGDASGAVYGASAVGFSGNPWTIVNANPSQSPRPFAYVADANKMAKINSDGTVYNVGIAQPLAPAALMLGGFGITVIEELVNAAGWALAGTVASAPGAAPARINTTISQVLYDIGNTGYASVAATNMANINAGCRLTLAAAETVTVERVAIAVASTSIGSIIYDVGTSGACSIQPLASLGVGILASPPIQAYEGRNPGSYGLGPSKGVPPQTTLATPVATPTIRQVDFPVDCLVALGGAGETVRIQAVTLGVDGIQGFRCVTVNTHNAGDSITGVASFRATLTTTRTGGDSVVEQAVQNTLTPPGTGPQAITGGIQKVAGVNGALIGGRATLSDDILHLSIKVDRLDLVTAIRVYLDVDQTTNNFLQNYYVFEWRANDIAAAIQGVNAAQVTTFVTTSQQVAENNLLDRRASYVIQNGVIVANTAGLDLRPVSAQLGVGNNQWVELTCRVGDLQRVGTDPSRTLQHIAAFEILVSATTAQVLTINYNALYFAGGFGPDVGLFGNPYVWRYRYRASQLGIVSNVSPATRASLAPRRQRCVITPTASADAQVDLIDYFRIGGGLTKWTYVGSGPNTSAAFNDDATDSSVDGGESPPFDDFQLWPTLDLARAGTANVAANALAWVSGDLFNVNWAPGALILVNGKACTIGQVISTTRLLIRENAGSGTAVAFRVQNAEVLGQPLPAFWGPFQVPGGGTVYFGCGDPNNPGTLYWTKSNNPDVTSDAYSLIVTSGAEVLQSGWIWDERAFVASSEQVYEIFPDYARPGQFIAVVTPCGRGPWTRWSFTNAPEGTYILDKAGIHLTSGGSVAKSVTEPDLTALFPHDANAGLALTSTKVLPPNYANPTRLRLSYVDKFVYFDYVSPTNVPQTLVFDTTIPRWYVDVYPLDTGIITRLWEPGVSQSLAIVAGNIGVYAVAGSTDNGAGISWEADTPWADTGDLRQVKQWGDVIVDLDTQGVLILVKVVDNYGQNFFTFSTGAGVVGRALSQPMDLNPGGLLARNIGLQITGISTVKAVLYAWEPSYVPKVEDTAVRATDWDDLGYPGAKFVQGIIIRANTYGQQKSLLIECDGAAIQQTFNAFHVGETEYAYPNVAAGWPPFIAQLVRLVGNDLLPWQLYGVRWVFEPAPEQATQWTAQPTTCDQPGYLQVKDLVLAHMSTADLSLTLAYDGGAFPPIIVPHSAGIYRRTYVSLPALKGRSVQPSITSTAPFRVFKRDCSWRVQGWGRPGGYEVQPLFGGPSRVSGAEV